MSEWAILRFKLVSPIRETATKNPIRDILLSRRIRIRCDFMTVSSEKRIQGLRILLCYADMRISPGHRSTNCKRE